MAQMWEKEFKIKFEKILQTTRVFTLILFPTTSDIKDMSYGYLKILSTAFVLNLVVTYFIGAPGWKEVTNRWGL